MGQEAIQATPDVLVIGAGPAGVTTALELVRAGRRVVLLPGGGRREDAAARDLHRGEAVDGPWSHEPLERYRRRAVGGASGLWGGRCVPLDPIDFEARDWVPASGWPLSYAEYWSWAQRACDVLDIGEAEFHRQPPGDLITGEPPEASSEGIAQDSLERWSAPFRFARLLGRDPDLRRRCEVLVGAHATCLLRGDDGSVTGVLTRRGGEERVLRARTYVLATGGLENARLMLHSGFGAGLPALGRYYMAHTVGTFLSVRLPPGLHPLTAFVREDGIYLRHRWRLDEAAQRSQRVGQGVAYFARASEAALAAHPDPLSSGVVVAKLAQDAVRRGPSGAWELLRQSGNDLRDHARVLRTGDAAFWGRAARLSAQRLARTSLPMVLPDPALPVQHLTYQAEHLPHRDSAVSLGGERDSFGVPRLRVRVELSDGDFDTVLALHRALASHLRRRGGEPLSTPEQVVDEVREQARTSFDSNAHHLGTTRMGTSARDSVVDADCRVHGSANLYVAGSSTFPTGGHANPTLSIVMLAARLGHHLASTRWGAA